MMRCVAIGCTNSVPLAVAAENTNKMREEEMFTTTTNTITEAQYNSIV